jgi:HlyD family secretion protein
MKKRGRIIKGIIIGVIVVAIIAVGVLYARGAFGTSTAATSTYQVSKLTTGDIEKSVTGTGTLEAGETSTITAPVDITIDTVKVEAGNSVKKGDVLATVDSAALDTTISSLQSQITTLDNTLQQLTDAADSSSYFRSAMEGRVKILNVEAGDDMKKVMSENGALMVLSTDGKMRLTATLTDASDVAPGKKVYVKTNSKRYTGVVQSVADDQKTCVITLTDNGPKVDAEATVWIGKTEIGSGKLEINAPVSVTTTTGGFIKKVYVKENRKVYKNTALAYLKFIPYSEDYTSQVKSKEKLTAQLQSALKMQSAGILTADFDGVINTLNFVDNTAYTANAALLTAYTSGASKLAVSVDELDIANVKADQDVSIAVDALSDKTYTGKVTDIAQVGTTTNGVTTYTVTIAVTGDDSLKIGMSATGTIVVEKHTNVLKVPLEALQSSRGQQYVWRYTGSLPEDSTQDPGTRTVVEVGLSDSDYAEVTSGLTADDQVVIVRTVSTSSTTSSNRSSNSNRQGGMFQMGGGGAMPQGGGGAPGGGRN